MATTSKKRATRQSVKKTTDEKSKKSTKVSSKRASTTTKKSGVPHEDAKSISSEKVASKKDSKPKPKVVPKAQVTLRTAAKLVRRGATYRRNQTFVVAGEAAIQAWENDGAFHVLRLPSE